MILKTKKSRYDKMKFWRRYIKIKVSVCLKLYNSIRLIELKFSQLFCFGHGFRPEILENLRKQKNRKNKVTGTGNSWNSKISKKNGKLSTLDSGISGKSEDPYPKKFENFKIPENRDIYPILFIQLPGTEKSVNKKHQISINRKMCPIPFIQLRLLSGWALACEKFLYRNI